MLLVWIFDFLRKSVFKNVGRSAASERLLPASSAGGRAAFKVTRVTFLPGFEPRQCVLGRLSPPVCYGPAASLVNHFFRFPPAELRPCRGQPKLPFEPFFFLITVKPALNVRPAFAWQRESVCSSLFSDVDSLITHNSRSLC